MRLPILLSCLLWFMTFMTGAMPIMAKDQPGLQWDPSRQTLSAEIPGWDLRSTLIHLARSTGWEILLEPLPNRFVDAAFQNAPIGEALGTLLDGLNFAMLPASKGTRARLYVFASQQSNATESIQAEDSAILERIGNELILRIAEGEDIQEIARKLGAKVVGGIPELRIYRLQFPNDEAARVAEQLAKTLPGVEQVSSNYRWNRPPSTPGDPELLAGGAPQINLRPKLGDSGGTLKIALIDTDVQREGWRFSSFLEDTLHIAQGASPSQSAPLHGTSMAESVLLGMNTVNNTGETGFRILPVDVYGAAEFANSFDVARGIVAAVEAGARIINMSLGGVADPPYLHEIIRNASHQGVLFVAAAGNEPTAIPSLPASYGEVLGVTAGSALGEVAPWANHAPQNDVVGPGSVPVIFGGTTYTVTGTSPASAFISGIAAGNLEYLISKGKNLTGPELQAILTQTLPNPKP